MSTNAVPAIWYPTAGFTQASIPFFVHPLLVLRSKRVLLGN
jgi:hypothetical protein